MKILFILCTLLLISPFAIAQTPDAPLLLTHFMPWNSAPPIQSTWGWHWTMNHFNPEKTDATGRREIASHYYPLTGPYDSQDEAIMEYQVLLMKLSGIDGMLVDWYGIGKLWDYPAINDRTLAIFQYVKKAKLTFAIVYEDQTIPNLIGQNIITKNQALTHAQSTMSWLQQTWFTQEAYLKIDEQPVLLTFGPQYFKSSSDWKTIFSVLPVQPLFFTLDNRLSPVAAGAFSWPPMWKSTLSGILTLTALQDYLRAFSQKSAAWSYRISSAFPGFHDIYEEASTGSSYGYLDRLDGRTFELTLSQARADSPHIIQLVTWNDYGEGTIIEPTLEFGYRYLEIVQDFKKQFSQSLAQLTHNHLRLPYRIFALRKSYPHDSRINATLDQIFDLLIDLKIEAALSLLNGLPVVVNENVLDHAPANFRLNPNYPNPFNFGTKISYELPQAGYVTFSIFDTRGRLVRKLVEENQPAGHYEIIWNGEDEGGQLLASGLFWGKLQCGEQVRMMKMIHLK